MQFLLKKAIVVHLCTNDGFMLERPTRLELATHLGKVALYQMSYGRRYGTSLHRLGMPPIGIEPMTRGFSVPCSTD